MIIDEKKAKELLVARAMCDDDLLFFTRFFYKLIHNKKFIVGNHHRVICDELKRIENYTLEFLGINIPPRFSKTELAAVNMIARGIGMNPNSNWFYITASDTLADQVSVSIREIVQHPYFKFMYGVELKKDQNAKNLWRTIEGGGLKTATIGGQITGFGAGQMIDNSELENQIREFEGCIIMDDINKIDDAQAENAHNDKVNRIIWNTISSRKNSKDTPWINIQQRAGDNDATAEFMEHYGMDNPKAKFLILPVEDENGIPLWEWKMDKAAIEEAKNSPKTAAIFQTQFMQNVEDAAGKLFPGSELQYYDASKFDRKKVDSCISIIDPKDDGIDSFCNLYGFLIGAEIYIDDLIFNMNDAEINEPGVAAKLREIKPIYTRIEKNGLGGTYLRKIQDKLPSDFPGMLIPSNTVGNKHSKIINEAAFIKKYFRFKRPENYEPGSDYDLFIKWLSKYNKNRKDQTNKEDGAPDGCAMLAVMARSHFEHLYHEYQ